MSEIKVGLVGCGGLGSRHAANVESAPGARLAAVSDVYRESAERLAGKLASGPAVYSDYEQMLASEHLDAVLVVTPNFTHSAIAVAAASAGAHVFCEKPMALTVENCDAMIDAARDAGTFLMIGYVRRFQAGYREMRDRVRRGDVGEVRMAHAVRLGSGPPGGSEGWQFSRDRYGGLFSMHSHELDQLTWMAGDVRAVQAMMKYGEDEKNTVEESIFINLEFECGAVGCLSSSRIYPVSSYELGVAGTDGALKISSGGGGEIVFCRRGEKPGRIPVEQNNALLDEILYFLDCVRTGNAPESDGLDGRRTIAISLAAHESARTGQRVEVKYRAPTL